MAFKSKDLSVLAYANGFTLWQYRSAADAIATMTGSGYFNEAASMLRAGDLMVISDNMGGSGIRRVASVTGGAVALSSLL